jgi:ATP-dependent DNA helicase RecQ
MKWLKKATKILQKHWKLPELKDKQIELIDNILNGNDTIGLLPTGYGKSLCYLLPPLLCKKVMIIISPLIALMDDQKDSLAKKGINCAVLHSNNKNRDEEIKEILNGMIHIIYMSPEWLVRTTDSEDDDETNFTGGMKLAQQLHSMDMLGFLAVDESHCCSVWGNDFRTEYKEIKIVREYFPDIPIMAVTATATTKVCKDIAKMLCLDDMKLVKGSFDRPNINISVMEIPMTSTYEVVRGRNKIVEKQESNKNLVLPYIKKYKDERIIIYIENKELTEELEKDLQSVGINALSYHAGYNAKKRIEIQTKFIEGECKVIICTSAFGMGIDQIVKCVIVIGCPKSIEEYYQQIGRAGRDNMPCEAVLFFDYSKYCKISFLMKREKDTIYRHVKEANMNKVVKYAYSTLCRRQHILEYFDEKCTFLNCDNCDNCCDLVDMTDKLMDIVKGKQNLLTIVNKIRNNFLQPIMNEKRKPVDYQLKDFLEKWQLYYSKNKDLRIKIPKKFLIPENKKIENVEPVDIFDKYDKLL